MSKKSFTLLELLTVIVIIGILATLGLVNYGPVKENSLNKEAILNLKLLQAAEKMWYMDYGSYYASTVIADINSNLKLDLPAATNRNWNYTVCSTACAQATRTGAVNRTWSLTMGDVDGEPDEGGTCPSCP